MQTRASMLLYFYSLYLNIFAKVSIPGKTNPLFWGLLQKQITKQNEETASEQQSCLPTNIFLALVLFTSSLPVHTKITVCNHGDILYCISLLFNSWWTPIFKLFAKN